MRTDKKRERNVNKLTDFNDILKVLDFRGNFEHQTIEPSVKPVQEENHENETFYCDFSGNNNLQGLFNTLKVENDSKHTIEDRKLFLSCINTPTHSGDNKKTRSNTRKEKLYTANNLCIKYNYLDNSQDFLVSRKVKPKHGYNKTLGSNVILDTSNSDNLKKIASDCNILKKEKQKCEYTVKIKPSTIKSAEINTFENPIGLKNETFRLENFPPDCLTLDFPSKNDSSEIFTWPPLLKKQQFDNITTNSSQNGFMEEINGCSLSLCGSTDDDITQDMVEPEENYFKMPFNYKKYRKKKINDVNIPSVDLVDISDSDSKISKIIKTERKKRAIKRKHRDSNEVHISEREKSSCDINDLPIKKSNKTNKIPEESIEINSKLEDHHYSKMITNCWNVQINDCEKNELLRVKKSIKKEKVEIESSEIILSNHFDNKGENRSNKNSDSEILLTKRQQKLKMEKSKFKGSNSNNLEENLANQEQNSVGNVAELVLVTTKVKEKGKQKSRDNNFSENLPNMESHKHNKKTKKRINQDDIEKIKPSSMDFNFILGNKTKKQKKLNNQEVNYEIKTESERTYEKPTTVSNKENTSETSNPIYILNDQPINEVKSQKLELKKEYIRETADSENIETKRKTNEFKFKNIEEIKRDFDNSGILFEEDLSLVEQADIQLVTQYVKNESESTLNKLFALSNIENHGRKCMQLKDVNLSDLDITRLTVLEKLHKNTSTPRKIHYKYSQRKERRISSDEEDHVIIKAKYFDSEKGRINWNIGLKKILNSLHQNEEVNDKGIEVNMINDFSLSNIENRSEELNKSIESYVNKDQEELSEIKSLFVFNEDMNSDEKDKSINNDSIECAVTKEEIEFTNGTVDNIFIPSQINEVLKNNNQLSEIESLYVFRDDISTCEGENSNENLETHNCNSNVQENDVNNGKQRQDSKHLSTNEEISESDDEFTDTGSLQKSSSIHESTENIKNVNNEDDVNNGKQREESQQVTTVKETNECDDEFTDTGSLQNRSFCHGSIENIKNVNNQDDVNSREQRYGSKQVTTEKETSESDDEFTDNGSLQKSSSTHESIENIRNVNNEDDVNNGKQREESKQVTTVKETSESDDEFTDTDSLQNRSFSHESIENIKNVNNQDDVNNGKQRESKQVTTEKETSESDDEFTDSGSFSHEPIENSKNFNNDDNKPTLPNICVDAQDLTEYEDDIFEENFGKNSLNFDLSQVLNKVDSNSLENNIESAVSDVKKIKTDNKIEVVLAGNENFNTCPSNYVDIREPVDSVMLQQLTPMSVTSTFEDVNTSNVNHSLKNITVEELREIFVSKQTFDNNYPGNVNDIEERLKKMFGEEELDNNIFVQNATYSNTKIEDDIIMDLEAFLDLKNVEELYDKIGHQNKEDGETRQNEEILRNENKITGESNRISIGSDEFEESQSKEEPKAMKVTNEMVNRSHDLKEVESDVSDELYIPRSNKNHRNKVSDSEELDSDRSAYSDGQKTHKKEPKAMKVTNEMVNRSDDLKEVESDVSDELYIPRSNKNHRNKVSDNEELDSDRSAYSDGQKTHKKQCPLPQRRLRSNSNIDGSELKSDDNDSDSDESFNNNSCRSVTKDDIEIIRQLKIKLSFTPAPLHKLMKVSSRPSKEACESAKKANLEVSTRNFSIQEDNIIRANWESFLKEYKLDIPPAAMFRFPFKMKLEQKLLFLNYLSQGLDNRWPYSVHLRFKKIFDSKKWKLGRFTEKEDKIILDYLAESESKTPYKDLEKILNRPSTCISDRFRNYQYEKQQKKTWDLTSVKKFVKKLMKVTKVEDIEELRDKQLTAETWRKMSQKMKGMPLTEVQNVWKSCIHHRLFSDDVPLSVVKMELLERLESFNYTEWKQILWKDVAKDFHGYNPSYLSRTFSRMVQQNVPQSESKDLKKSLSFLREKFSKMKARKSREPRKFEFVKSRLQYRKVTDD